MELEILDPIGKEEYYTFVDHWISSRSFLSILSSILYSFYYLDAQGIMLVYRINDRRTLSDVIHRDFIHLIHVPVLLVGSACDKDDEREISYEEGEILAKKNGFSFMEASSLSGLNVTLAFETLGKMILLQRRQRELA